VPIAPLSVGGTPIPWVTKIRYLGVDILSAKCFSICLHGAKIKFFQSLNAILGKIGDVNAIPLILSLTATNCNPVLMYALDACPLSSAQISSLAYAYNAVFCKIFKSFDRNIISNCQYYTGTLPLKYAYDLGRLRLLASFHNAIGTPAGFLYKFDGRQESECLRERYNLALPLAGPAVLKKKVWDLFEREFIQ